MNELSTTHAAVRTALTDLLRRRGADEVADLPVPACPAWTVHDVLAHLAGVGADILAGNLEGVASDPWTAAQVDARRAQPLSSILDELEATDPQVEAIADAFGAAQTQWLFDCITHDADVRGALGEPVLPVAHDVLLTVTRFVAGGYALFGRQAGVPLARLRADGVAVVEGDDLGPAEVDVEPFELVRGLSGRRSAEQLRAWAWSGDEPDRYLAGFSWGPFTVRDTPLEV